MSQMRVVIMIMAVLAACTLTPVTAQRRGGTTTTERTVRVGAESRRYLLHLPPARFDGPLPVVLAFHGGASNPDGMVRLTGLDDKADREGFIAVFPAGTGRFPRILTWNAGACCAWAAEHQVDDVAFVRALLDDIARVAPVDTRRVYATGISNGGMLAYRLAVELPDRIAAIAPVAASLEVPIGPRARPVPVMHFHGTADANVPFEGGTGPRTVSGVAYASVAENIGTWVRVNGCDATPRIRRLPDRVDDGTTVERRDYTGCRDHADVVLVVIDGGGHTWPGTPRLERLLGVATRDISATDMMWSFFDRHRG